MNLPDFRWKLFTFDFHLFPWTVRVFFGSQALEEMFEKVNLNLLRIKDLWAHGRWIKLSSKKRRYSECENILECDFSLRAGAK